jgi:hypothetical protein
METLKARTAKTVSFNRFIVPYIRALCMIRIRLTSSFTCFFGAMLSGVVETVAVIMDIIHFSPHISLFITLSGF